MNHVFSMTNLGLLSQFWGIKIYLSYIGIKVHQSKYDSYLLNCSIPLKPQRHYAWKRGKVCLFHCYYQRSQSCQCNIFTWYFNEACQIKFNIVKTTHIVKQSFDNLYPSSSSEPKHAVYIQFTRFSIDSITNMNIMLSRVHMIN